MANDIAALNTSGTIHVVTSMWPKECFSIPPNCTKNRGLRPVSLSGDWKALGTASPFNPRKMLTKTSATCSILGELWHPRVGLAFSLCARPRVQHLAPRPIAVHTRAANGSISAASMYTVGMRVCPFQSQLVPGLTHAESLEHTRAAGRASDLCVS